MKTTEQLHEERESIQQRIVACQDRYATGDRSAENAAAFDAARAESNAFDASHPEIKAEVIAQLRAYHQKRNPFGARRMA